jgi:hypothetical protein
MKFEDFIKEKVAQNQEVYDPAAWDKLSAKMNATASASASKATSFKWWIAASITTVALVSGLFFINKSNKETKPQITSKNTQTNTSTPKENVITIEDKQANTSKNTTLPQVNIEEKQANKPIIVESSKVHANQDVFITEKSTAQTSTENSSTPKLVEKETKSNSWVAFTLPTKICKGDNVTAINNNNEVVSVKGNSTTLKIGAKQALSTGSLVAGNYTILSLSGKELQSFTIVDVPKLDFIAENTIYDKGIPYIPVKITNNELDTYNWSLNNQTIGTKKEILVPAFTKGGVKIKFNGIENGCNLEETYLVSVSEDYNLLAVNAFNIDSRDERNKTFLPNALYDRTENFEMQIIDPKNNEIIFTSHSTSEPWNGIDKRTGELVPANTRFIWTVRLSEKANYEAKSVYQGVVLRVTY